MYKVLGLMSGTSLDGLDMALCSFDKSQDRWSFTLHASKTESYPEIWQADLRRAMQMSAAELLELDHQLGSWMGERALHYLTENGLEADFIASHGHTIYHQPQKGFTLQIGKGSSLSAAALIPVVSDFRSLDIALGGQGAPLVPIGDRLLFHDYDFCLNLGGIANISFEIMGHRQAFDICPVNMALNLIAEQMDLRYDDKGQIARSGVINPTLLDQLNTLPFYETEPPKSLGREWFESEFEPLLRKSGLSFRDLLATCVEHIAIQTGRVLNGWKGRMLVTGGGAWNEFLIERILSNNATEVVIPEADIVNYKEALIFAFLGLLRWTGEINTLSSVTGALRDSSGGVIWSV